MKNKEFFYGVPSLNQMLLAWWLQMYVTIIVACGVPTVAFWYMVHYGFFM